MLPQPHSVKGRSQTAEQKIIEIKRSLEWHVDKSVKTFVLIVICISCSAANTVMYLKQTSSGALTGASTKCNYSRHFLFVTEVCISCFYSPLCSSLGCCFHKSVQLVACWNIGDGQRFHLGTKFSGSRAPGGMSHQWKLGCAGVDVD